MFIKESGPVFIVEKNKKVFGNNEKKYTFAPLLKEIVTIAKIAQLVEHDLAKVGVAGSSPVFRSNFADVAQG